MCRADRPPPEKQRGLSLVKGLVAILAVAALVVIANYYLERHITQAERMALTSIARNFSTTMAMIHGKWVIEGKPGSQKHQPMVMIENQTVYLSAAGWPKSTEITRSETKQTSESCAQLWQLVTGAAITTADATHKTKARYIASSPDNYRCRYALMQTENPPHYFDYNHKNGKVQLNTE